MGKGDKKTKRGKISIGSYGKKRRKKEKISAIKPAKAKINAKVATKPKATPKPKTEEKPEIEIKEKVVKKPKAVVKEKATPKKAEPKVKPKKEKEE